MYKYLFFNDYSEGAHPNILALLSETNFPQEEGYGVDSLCKKAATLIKDAVQNPEVDVHFVSGGTQANLIVLASLLKPYECVIAPSSGHINTHEAGGIEATGHKIVTAPSTDGKITSKQIQDIYDAHTDEHMVKPKVVFISQSTEVGMVYTKAELEAISQICKKLGIYLYIDGARLGSALTSNGADVTLPDLARLADVFYIGGTKNGALLGEAIVICNKEVQPNFRYHLKQRGALLAKGRILGVQFVGLFTDNLFFTLAKQANSMAQKLSKGIRALGYTFLTDSQTNQIFPIFPNPVIDNLQKLYGFYVWSKVNETSSAVRLVTSWATKEDSVDEFLKDLQSMTGK